LRRTVLNLAAFAICISMQAFAQSHPPHPPNPLAALLGPHSHARPVPPDSEQAADVTVDASKLGSPLHLDKGWRVGITDNIAPAKPGFDDSEWSIRDAQDVFADVADPDNSADEVDRHGPSKERPLRYAWFRMHIKLAPGHGPLALLVELPVAQTPSMTISSTGPGVDVFANGVQIQPDGPHGDNPQHYQQISRLYNLNVPASETDLFLVLRTFYKPFGYGAYTTFFSARTFHLGHPEDLGHRLELWSTHALFQRLPRIVNSILLLVLALFLLALYFTQKGHVEYLWLALHELVQAPIGFIELAGGSARLDSLWYAATILQLVLGGYRDQNGQGIFHGDREEHEVHY